MAKTVTLCQPAVSRSKACLVRMAPVWASISKICSVSSGRSRAYLGGPEDGAAVSCSWPDWAGVGRQGGQPGWMGDLALAQTQQQSGTRHARVLPRAPPASPPPAMPCLCAGGARAPSSPREGPSGAAGAGPRKLSLPAVPLWSPARPKPGKRRRPFPTPLPPQSQVSPPDPPPHPCAQKGSSPKSSSCCQGQVGGGSAQAGAGEA